MDEGKKMIISFLRVTGILLVGFPIFIYFNSPHALFAILPFVISSMVIGAILITLSIVIWKRNQEVSQTRNQPAQ